MKFERVLHDLLEQPFGPYLEETVLSDKCRFMPSKRLLLDDFQLAHNDEPTGYVQDSLLKLILSHNHSFDHTEFDGALRPSSVIQLEPIPSGSRVLFRGVLSLLAITHLSEEGLKYLNHDFKERITRSAMNGVLAIKRHTSLDLEGIFTLRAKQKDIPDAEKYTVSVLIQGYMHSTASFMRCVCGPYFIDNVNLSLTVADLAPNGLLFHTANASKMK
jgi:hypothetical protein